MRFDGVRVLITGGGSGIGLATARAFLAEGARVAINGRNEEKLRAAAAALSSDRLLTLAADVSEPEQAHGVVTDVSAALGGIDVLVNNAGTNIKRRSVRELSIEDWQTLVRVNLDSAFYCCRAVLPQMLARKNGLIVNISSVSGLRAAPVSGAGYAAAKFGMTALGLCLAAEEREAGLRVTNICPGEVDTPILDNRPKALTAEERERILKPEDVADAVLFVAGLPARAHVPELIIKPTHQFFV